MVKIILPLPPSVNRLWRVSKTGGMFRSPQYEKWRKQAGWEVLAQAKGKKIRGRYKMTLLAVNPTRHKRDLDNLLKAASDILQHVGIVEDDSLCRWIDARWMDEGPQCTIIVEELDEQNSAG